ncbi:ATP-binding cassette domain-containing protein [Streptomyces sp. NPDC048436]|uniref:ABC transporter permease subunit n=1 Tax=Streptomyces sp. NPDC048436 TaxID=3365550 RepID=UPI0037235693
MASLSYDLTLAGLAIGSAAALTGIGLIVTYRATGVLNFAHGAIAMVCAYVLRQLTVDWNWPLPLATAVTLLLVAPAIGLLLEKAVFRPLSVLGSDPAQTLVASIGVFILLVGGAALIWGQGARADAPTLVSADPWTPLAVTIVLAATVWAVTRWTRFGSELRAVVDNRPLAVLSGIDADRVASAGWAFGAFTAGLTGALLAPFVRLDPYGMPLLVMEVVAVAVAARMRSLLVAVVAALGLGVAQSQLTRFHPGGRAEPLLQALGANLFVVALLVTALALPGIGSRNMLPRTATARVSVPPGAWIVAGVLFLIPLGFAGSDLTTSVQVPALAVILLSLVIVTGRGGQISLGQAAYAGLGALFTALLAAGRFPGLPPLPHLPALAVAVLLVAPLGLLTGWPAISRRGLALALATFAVGVGVSRFVFAQPYATSGLALERPAGFGGDRAYYVLELVLLAAALLFAAGMRRGRMGRALAAMRDHEAGAAAAGVPVRTLKLTAFVAGAALAALGGGMLAMGLRAFDPTAYDPVRGLLWFAAVVVLGADSLLGALVAAALLVGLDAGARGGVAAALIGVLAVLLGRFPGGLYEALRLAAAGLARRPSLTPLGRGVRGALPQPGPGSRRPSPRPNGLPRRARITPWPNKLPHPPARSPRGTPSTNKLSHPPTRLPHSTTSTNELSDSAPQTPTHRQRTNNPPHPPDRMPNTATTDDSPQSPTRRERPNEPSRPPGPMPGTATTDNGPQTPVRREETGSGTPHGDPQTPARRDGASHDGPQAPTRRDGAGSGATHDSPQSPTRPEGTWRYFRPEHGSWHSGSEVATRPPDDGEDGHTGAAPPPRRTRGEDPHPHDPHEPATLTAHHLTATYDGFTALDRIDLDVPPGHITAVVGPNGAGKSTLFHCLAGTLRPDSGRITLGCRDLTHAPAHTRTRLGIARTFQQLAVFPSLTITENVQVGAEQGRCQHPQATTQALRLLSLHDDTRHHPAANLPTGTLRRVELARALAGHPHTLLLDEPTAGLDTAEVSALARILKALAADGMALLVVEHDLDLVADLADTVHVMTAGRIIASGPADEVLHRATP